MLCDRCHKWVDYHTDFDFRYKNLVRAKKYREAHREQAREKQRKRRLMLKMTRGADKLARSCHHRRPPGPKGGRK